MIQPDSIQAEDIRSWIDALHCSATVVVDTYQSHAISFGKLSTVSGFRERSKFKGFRAYVVHMGGGLICIP